MGRYIELIAGQGNLEGVDGDLVEQRARDSEAEAGARIDVEFASYDRSWWTPKAQPPEISRIASRIAAAEYIERSFQAASQSVSTPASAKQMRERAGDDILTAKGRGWLLGIDGNKVYPKGGKSGSMFVELGVELEDDGLSNARSTTFPGLGPRGPY